MSPLFKVAATLLLVAVFGFLLNRFFQASSPELLMQSTGSAQTALVELEDGTRVLLNAGSELTYPETFSSGLREVTLVGEAFFDVRRDTSRPFIVKSGEVNTEVLGTSFNITSYAIDETIEVTVATGKVKVTNKNAVSIELTPGEQGVYTKNDDQLIERTVVLDKYLSWRNGIVQMDNTPLSELVEKLEKWYGVEIELENESLGNCPLTGKYKLDALQNILASLKLLHGLEHEYINDKKSKINRENLQLNAYEVKPKYA